MSTTATRLASEQAFHDAQAARRRAALTDEMLRFADDDYLDHETWVRPAFERLGDIAGRRVLDLGSGHGMAAIVMARRGARVTGLELSRGYLDEGRARAEANGVGVDWIHGDGERMPFADASFDRVWCHAVLHHLDVDRAASEIERVLAPGGWAVVCEPWGDNPLLRWARNRAAYDEKDRTADEAPLRSDCLPVLRRRFPDMQWQGYQLMEMVRRVARNVSGRGGWTRGLATLDRVSMAVCPPLRWWCRYAVIVLPRKPCA